MAERDRLYYSRKYKQLNQSLSSHEITCLGLDTLSKLELFKLAIAYGLEDPKDFDGAKEGLFNLRDIKSTADKALINTILLGVANDNDEIDQYCDMELNYAEAERCANTGFGKLKELIENNKDEDLLIKRMFLELDNLYLKNVKL